MSDQQTQTPAQAPSEPEYKPEDIQAMAEELERLRGHHGKLLEETKTAKQRAKELEEAQAAAEQDALKKSGEFQKLWESEAEKAARLQRELEETQANYREKEKARQQNELIADAQKAVLEIAVDEASLEILAEKAAKFAVYTENGVEYQIGGVTVPKAKVLETLSTKYPRLIKGSGSTGGGAIGGARGGASTTTAADAAKAKGDLTGFITASLNKF